MDKPTTRRHPTADSAGEPPAENLDKVRDLLFGTAIRDQQKSLSRVEEKLSKELADAREQFLKRLASMETFFKGEIDGLVERIKSEAAARTSALRETNAELASTTKASEKRDAELDAKINDAARDLRKAILEQSKALRDEVQASHAAAMSALDKNVASLRSEKADRHAVADLLTEMALKLKGEFKMPKGG